jgi:hypothetical protein
MKIQEFRNLIREEVKKILRESVSFANEATSDTILYEDHFKPLFKTMTAYDPLTKGQRAVFDFFTDVYYKYLAALGKRDKKTNMSPVALDNEYGDVLKIKLERETGDRVQKYNDYGKALIKAGYVKLSKEQEDRLAELGYDVKKMK